MDCKRYSDWIDDAAAGASNPGVDAELQRHLAKCKNCLQAFERQRKLLAVIDQTVMQTLAAEPSPQALARIRQRIAAESIQSGARRLGSLPLRLGIMAASVLLIAAAVVSWSTRHHSFNGRVSSATHVSVVEKSALPKPPVSVVPAEGNNSQVLAANRRFPQHRHNRAGTKRERQGPEQPYVLVEKDEAALVAEFYNKVPTNLIEAAPAANKESGLNRTGEQSLVIAPLKIKPITIAALNPDEDRRAGRER
jgi:hypothetical protein